MYDELVKELRHIDEFATETNRPTSGIFREAADAIVELSRENESLAKSVNEASEILRKRWIPVTERLPKAGVYVLAYSADDGYMCVEARHKFSVFQITHWMPLPEPPEEE